MSTLRVPLSVEMARAEHGLWPSRRAEVKQDCARMGLKLPFLSLLATPENVSSGVSGTLLFRCPFSAADNRRLHPSHGSI